MSDRPAGLSEGEALDAAIESFRESGLLGKAFQHAVAAGFRAGMAFAAVPPVSVEGEDERVERAAKAMVVREAMEQGRTQGEAELRWQGTSKAYLRTYRLNARAALAAVSSDERNDRLLVDHRAPEDDYLQDYEPSESGLGYEQDGRDVEVIWPSPSSPTGPMDDEIERAAKAIYETYRLAEAYVYGWDTLGSVNRKPFIEQARAALTAAREVPDGDER